MFICDANTEFHIIQSVHITDGKILAITVAPDNQDILAVGTSNGVFLSWDRGKTWEEFNRGLPEERSEVNALVFSQRDATRVFAGLFIGVYSGQIPERPEAAS